MQLLDERLMILNADMKSAEDCIRTVGSLFLKYDYVKEGYPQAVVDREKIYPTGLPGKTICIAIPHTNCNLVNKPAIGVIIPKKPVKFLMMGTKDKELECEVILPLVIKNPEMQIKMLKKMMKIIQDADLLVKIRDAKSKKEIMDYLSVLEED